MELNREQIIKALECCSKEICEDCPYRKEDIFDISCAINMSKASLALIKELTEESENWKAIAEGYQKQFEDCAEDRARLTEENERLRALNTELIMREGKRRNEIPIAKDITVKADTVRKMQEKLRDGHLTATNPNVICLYESELDKIAKELMGVD